ncbi:MAG: phosphatidylserine decarboxylase [Candidatus Dadabacteria bacterium]|nr:MAG: phosphatidylserine decarboxylase [Candidatus Dadabacteria bacterium]
MNLLLHYLSWLSGFLAGVKWPAPVRRLLLKCFVRLYGIEMQEAEKPLESYNSLNQLFIRDIRAELRPTGEGIVAPVDGVLRDFGKIDGDHINSIKGQSYSLKEFLADQHVAERFIDGNYLYFYLSPRHAHHIFSPIDGRIYSYTHIPGALWPVNSWGVEKVARLLVVNERVVNLIDTEVGVVALVMIAATNVGKIELHYLKKIVRDKFLLRPAGRKIERIALEPPVKVIRAEKLGTFHLGSAVVVLFEKNAVSFSESLQRESEVKYGESVGLPLRRE